MLTPRLSLQSTLLAGQTETERGSMFLSTATFNWLFLPIGREHNQLTPTRFSGVRPEPTGSVRARAAA
jgi:hypothetical protein